MLRRIVWLLTLGFGLVGQAAWAQETAPPAPAPPPLTKEEIASAVSDEGISLPMPGELFAALGKQGRIDWTAFLRKAPSGTFTSRQQIALNIGALIADGYLAVEAQDKQHVKNVAKDIRTLAKGIGVEEELVSRGNSIVQFAESGQWDTLKEELEATQNDVIDAMIAHKDQELVTLVMLGGWLRGTEVVSGYVASHYAEGSARVLRQPAVVDHFVQKLAKMPKKVTDTPLMSSVRLVLFDIKKALTFAPDATPTAEEVHKLNELATGVIKTISTRN
jgi:hypothetical protein